MTNRARLTQLSLWRSEGRRLVTPDGGLFVVDRNGPGVPALLLHGFPTSSWDFSAALTELPARRVVAFDFLGFGLSDKPRDFGYSLFEHADAAVAVARDAGLTRAHVWAHDMGTSVLTELCARSERGLLPFEIASLALMNGSVHIELARLTPGQRLLRSRLGPLFARLNTRWSFEVQFRRVFARAPGASELDGMWELLTREDGLARLPAQIRYTTERSRHARRWIGALTRWHGATLVAWGDRDPVAVPAIADRLACEIPGAERVSWSDLGHYPHVEDAARVAREVAAFWSRAESR